MNSNSCSFCNVTYTSDDHRRAHESGRKHQNKVKMAAASEATNVQQVTNAVDNLQLQSRLSSDTVAPVQPHQLGQQFTPAPTQSQQPPTLLPQPQTQAQQYGPYYPPAPTQYQPQYPTQFPQLQSHAQQHGPYFSTPTQPQQPPTQFPHPQPQVPYCGTYCSPASAQIQQQYSTQFPQPQTQAHPVGQPYTAPFQQQPPAQFQPPPQTQSQLQPITSSPHQVQSQPQPQPVNNVINLNISGLPNAGTVHQSGISSCIQQSTRPSETANAPGTPAHFCEVCGIDCGNDYNYKQHLNGSKHLKKVANSQTPPRAPKPEPSQPALSVNTSMPANPFFCDKCRCTCNSQKTFDEHCRSASHVRRMEGSNEEPEYFCEVCECPCSGQAAWEQHNGGQRHKKNMERIARLSEAENSGPTNRGDAPSEASPVPASIRRNPDALQREFFGLKMKINGIVMQEERFDSFKQTLSSSGFMLYGVRDRQKDKDCLAVLERLEHVETFTRLNVSKMLDVAVQATGPNGSWWQDLRKALTDYSNKIGQ